MADYHLEDIVYELNYESAKIARKERMHLQSPDVNDPGYRAVSFDDLRIAYKQQVEALIDGGSVISGNHFRHVEC
jgi:5-methyltetrahydrofolate--homocysteine methyltransferase